MLIVAAGTEAASAQDHEVSHERCRVQPATYEGWRAEEISNEWAKLTIVPQLGGRVMQMTFAGHPYLFVKPQLKGKYYPPVRPDAKRAWFNYGGDKIWPMPEGTQDDEHWAGPVADALDDGEYSFRILFQDADCSIRLESPPEPKTGLQYTREISIGSNSPEISFRAAMKNISRHNICWSVQSVTQYDTDDPHKPGDFNRDFWAFAPVHPQSAYLGGFHVRSGLADDPSFSVKNRLFTLHWMYLQNEVWLDSPAGWLAVLDVRSGFAMVERFRYQKGAEYPGKATIIFYKNGPFVEMGKDGVPFVTTSNAEDRLHYMEAEINSPMVQLKPSETYVFETKWYRARIEKQLIEVRETAVVASPLTISSKKDVVTLAEEFGVFSPGRLEAWFYDRNDVATRRMFLRNVDPGRGVKLQREIAITKLDACLSIHLIDERGRDRGSLGEAAIAPTDQEL